MNALRHWSKKVLFVTGGTGPTFNHRKIMNLPEFKQSLLVVGEGERALADIIQCAAQAETTKELCDVTRYKNIANVCSSVMGKKLRRRRLDLNDYRFDERLAMKEYLPRAQKFGFHQLEMSRGCASGQCSFCSIQRIFVRAQTVTRFPLQAILEEIRFMAAQGILRFVIHDWEISSMTLGGSGCRLAELADAFEQLQKERKQLGQQPLSETVNIHANVVMNERDSVERLTQAGFGNWFIGIESFSDAQLKRFRKGTSAQENKDTIRFMQRLGCSFKVYQAQQT